MASEYVSFMLVFAVGISMVVGITITMQGLTDSVSQTSAEVALEKIIDQVKGKLNDGVNNVDLWNGKLSFEINLDLTRLLVNKYAYELHITSTSGSFNLVGQSTDSSVKITKLTPLNFNINDFSINGTILSSKSSPYVLIQKDNSGINVILGNK